MKKLTFLICIFIIYSDIIFSTPTGNGTLTTPYSGSVTENTTWYPDIYPGQTIYAANITIAWGITLTISPGVSTGGYVQFLDTYTLTIGDNGTLIINPGTAVTVDNIINNGTLRLESNENETGVASLIHRTYSGSGSEINQVRLYLSGGTTSGDVSRWHYISSPVAGINVSTFATLNLAQYVEPLVTGADNYPGWVAWDGYQYSGGTQPAYAFSVLTLGHGYNYHGDAGAVFTLSGGINIADRNMIVTCGSGFPDYQGYNLLGNPFASCLDWDIIIADFPPVSVNNAIYFTLNGVIAAYADGIGVNGGTGTIPPLQGFFVKAVANSSVLLPAVARTHNLDQMRYKKKSTEVIYKSSDTISFVRLQLEHAGDSTDLVVRFNNKATASVDKMFDAYKFSKTSGNIDVWTTTGDVDFSINGLPFPETTVEIPVGLNVKTTGIYRLSSSEFNKLDNYSISLKDLLTNAAVNLKQGGFFEFDAPAGMIENRFVLAVTKAATTVPEVPVNDKKFSIYSSSGIVNILLLTDDFSNTSGSVTIYDLTGRKIFQKNKIAWQNAGDLEQIVFNPSGKGLYLVEVKAGNLKYVEKIALQ